MALNPKQERFCREYVIDLNGTQAAIRAEYSKKTADVKAVQLLGIVKVQELIKELQSKISDRLEITADMVVRELAKIGFSNIQDYIEDGNTIADIKNIHVDKAASVESIKIVESEWGSGDRAGSKVSTTFKLYDKVSALEKIGRHLGIFEKDNAQVRGKIIVTRKKIANQ